MSVPSAKAYAELEAQLAARDGELALREAELNAERTESAARARELEVSQAYQSATAEVLKVIGSSAADAQPVFEKILDSCGALFNVREMMIGLVSDDGQVHAAAWRGDRMRHVAQVLPRPLEETLTGLAIAERRTLHTPDAAQRLETLLPGQRNVFERIGNFSNLCAPILHDGLGIGAIELWCVPPRPFPDKEIALLTTFADQAVIAIENARLFKETQETLEQQVALTEVLSAISRSRGDLQPIFDVLAEQALTLSACGVSVIATFDGDMMGPVAYRNAPDFQQFRDRLEVLNNRELPAKPDRRFVTGRAILDKAVVQMPNVETDTEFGFPEDAREMGLVSCLAVPFLREDECVGAIFLGRREAGELSERQIKLLTAFADQAVIAIENARLIKETEEALEQQTATAEVLQVISSSPTSTQPVFQAIAERARAVSGYDFCNIVSYDGEFMRLEASVGLTAKDLTKIRGSFKGGLADGAHKPSHGSAVGRALLTGKLVNIADHMTDLDFEHSAVPALQRNRALVAVPLVHNGRTIGGLTLGRAQPGEAPEKLIRLLQTFADQAVIAIENARLFRETQEALQKQTAMSGILEVISTSRADVRPVYEKILDACASLLDSEELVILNEYEGIIQCMAHRGSPGFARLLDSHYPRPVGESAHSTLVSLGRTHHIPSLAALPQMPSPVFLAVYETIGDCSYLTAPLLDGGNFLGALNCLRHPPRPFTNREADLLMGFADQATIAIQNARQFNETREALEQQTATAEVLQVISSSPTSTRPVFEAIAERARAVSGYDFCNIASYDGEWIHLEASIGMTSGELTGIRDFFRAGVKPTRASAIGRAILTGKIVAIADHTTDAEFEPFLAGLRYRALAGVPLIHNGHTLGALTLGRVQPGEAPEKLLRLLQTFADQAVIAINNVGLFKATQEALEHQTATTEVLRVIGSSVADAKPVFEKILDSCKALFGVDELMVSLMDDDGQLHVGAARGLMMERLAKAMPMPLEETVAMRLIIEKRTPHIPDVGVIRDEAPSSFRYIHDEIGNFSCIAAPLLRDGRGIGTIGLMRFPPKPFTDKEIA